MMDDLIMAHDNLQKELAHYKSMVSMDKHELIKSNISKIKRIDELEREIEKDFSYSWKLLMDIKRYREALEFYADKETYEEVVHEAVYQGGMPIEPPSSEPPLIYLDNYGDTARKALESESDE